MMRFSLVLSLLLLLSLSFLGGPCDCFSPSRPSIRPVPVVGLSHPKPTGRIRLRSTVSSNDERFEVTVDVPPSGSGLKATMNIDSILPGKSELIQVRYKLPFGLDVAPKDNLAVCTKDGQGGEKVGDVLRFTSSWSLGLPMGDGLISTAAAFSGGVKWQCTMFDVMKASKWQEVVEALTSNVDTRTDEVVLLFERPLQNE